jgi:hypothetical protein
MIKFTYLFVEGCIFLGTGLLVKGVKKLVSS